jgi:hypothetical protein
LSINSVPAGRDVILEMPICRLVAKRLSAPLII